MNLKFNRHLVVVVLLLLGFTIQAQVSGPNATCVSNTVTYTLSSGYSVEQSTDYQIVKIVGNDYDIKFTQTGTIPLKYKDANGTISSTNVDVYYPAPYIALSENRICDESITPIEGGSGGLILDEEECQQVCDSTCVWYYASSYASYPSQKFKWVIHGATNYNSTDTITADSIEVCWGTMEYGSVILIEESPDGCSEYTQGCVHVLKSNYDVDFGIPPDTTKDTFYVCQYQEVTFQDFSTMRNDPDVESWCWDFGEGFTDCGDVELDGLPPEVVEYQYTDVGVYSVKLSYTTRCGCTAVKEKIVVVDSGNMMEIYCNNPACANDIVEYYTDSICPNYSWSVTNGTILGSSTGNSIEVEWGDPDNGIGIITLRALGDCDVCNPEVSLKINILPTNPKLIYPKFACAGDNVTHTGIIMPATKYSWHGDIHSNTKDTLYYTNAIMPSSSANNNSSFATGNYTMTLHNWYGDTLCSSTKGYSTVIQDTFHWIGPDTVCKNGTASYSMSLSSPQADTIIVEGGSPYTEQIFTNTNSISLPFVNSGTYYIRAIDSFFCSRGKNCVKEVIVPDVRMVDSVVGDTEVCLNTFYTYKAYSKTPGNKLNWIVEGGNLKSSSGETATIEFNTLGTKKIGVYASMITPPYCKSDTLWIDINNPIRKNTILGSNQACANGTLYYELEEKRGYGHEWSFYPDNNTTKKLGSIFKETDQKVKITFNDVTPQTVTLRVVYRHCSDYDTAYKTFDIIAPPPMHIIGPDKLCVGSSAQYACNIDHNGKDYSWHSVSGLGITNKNNQTATVLGNSVGTYSLNVSAYSLGCGSIISKSKVVEVKPTPNATLTFIGNKYYCIGSSPNTVQVNVSTIGSGTYTFNPSVPFSTNQNNTTVVVTDVETGCSATTNPLIFVPVTCGGGGGGKCNPVTPAPTINFNYSVNCNTVTFSVSSSGGTITNISVEDLTSGAVVNGSSGTFTYNDAGKYSVKIEGQDANGCRIVTIKEVVVPLRAKMYASFLCIDGVKKIALRDYSVVATPNMSISSVSWNITGPGSYSQSGSGSKYTTPNTTSLASGTYNVTMTVSAGGQTCTASETVVVDPDYVPTFTLDNQVCTGNKASFLLTHPSQALNVLWKFGDGSKLLGGKDAARQYHFKASLGTPNTYNTSIEITDIKGCKYESNFKPIIVYPNLFNDFQLTMNKNNVCITQAPITLLVPWNAYPSGRTVQPNYVWNRVHTTTSNTYDVYKKGRYFVEIEDQYGCKKTSKDTPANFFPIPVIEVVGRTKLCEGEKLDITFDAGSNNLSLISNVIGIKTNKRVYNSYAIPGNYFAEVTASNPSGGCVVKKTVGIDVYPNPALTIQQSRMSCKPYKVALMGNGTPNPITPFSAAYHWAKGKNGSMIEVKKGGTYSLIYTNEHKCKAYDTAEVDKELKIPAGFPKGCLNKPCIKLCYDSTNTRRYEVNLNYDRSAYDLWEWIKDGVVIASGVNSVPTNPFYINTNVIGIFKYHLRLTHKGCTVTSPTLHVEVYDCCAFEVVDEESDYVICDDNGVTLSPKLNGNIGSGAKYTWYYQSNVVSRKRKLLVTEPGDYKLVITIPGCSQELDYTVFDCTIIPEIELENVEDWNSHSTLVAKPQNSGLDPYVWSYGEKKDKMDEIYTGNPLPVSHCDDTGWYEVQSEKCKPCPNSKARIYFDPKTINYKK